jgi:hypothetical protein
VCIFIYKYVCIYTYIEGGINVYIYLYMYACLISDISVYRRDIGFMNIYIQICMYVSMYTYIYLYIYKNIYRCKYVYI